MRETTAGPVRSTSNCTWQPQTMSLRWSQGRGGRVPATRRGARGREDHVFNALPEEFLAVVDAFEVLELAEELEARQLHLALNWRRREENQLADDLTNEVFDKFSEGRRIMSDFSDLDMPVLDKMSKAATDLFLDLRTAKEAARASGGGPVRRARGHGRATKLSGW